jgi:peptide deformylase
MEFKLGNHDTLHTISTDWDFVSDGDSEKLESEMASFMLKNNGIGLAGNQIQITKRVFTMGAFNIPGFPLPFALFNPRIIEQSSEFVLDKEGCLSFPGLELSIKRPDWVVVEFENSKGDTQRYKAQNYAAKCVQHELDHLNGICFVDIVSPLKLKLANNKLRKKLNDRT